MRAALHFQQVLELNENDTVAGEYLYGCYMELNRGREAYEVYQKLPPSSREKLKKSLPKFRQVIIEQGFINCNQMEKFDSLDLDGNENIYGETDLTQDGFYFNGGLSWGFKNGCSVYGAYRFIKLNKNKLAEIGDSLSVDDLYPMKQHQVYLNGNIPLGKGFSILPAFNLVMDRYETVMPRLAMDSVNYLFPVEKFSYSSFIGYLAVTKDFNIVQTTLFAAYSNLDREDQYQAGFQAMIYPFGNLNFYLSSTLINHMNDGENHIIFDQMAGFRLSKSFRAEVNATFGKMQNYHENHAFVVYNMTDDMKFKGGAKLIFMLDTRWIITGEYRYLLHEGEYIYYGLDDNEQVMPVTVMKDFNSHIYLIGINWRF